MSPFNTFNFNITQVFASSQIFAYLEAKTRACSVEVWIYMIVINFYHYMYDYPSLLDYFK